MKLTDLGPCRCPYILTSPEQAGYVSWERLKEAEAAFPHLRSCGKENFAWIDKKNCEYCKEGLRDVHEG